MTSTRPISILDSKKEFTNMSRGIKPNEKGTMPEFVYNYVENDCESCSPIKDVAKGFADNISYAISTAEKNNNMSITQDVEFSAMPDYIGGTYNIKNKDIDINQNLVGDKPLLARTVNHELKHKKAHAECEKKYGTTFNLPEELEEGLCESGNDRDFGAKSDVYVQHKSKMQEMASVVNKPIDELIDLYETGEFPTLLFLWQNYQYIKNRTISNITYIIT